MLLPEVLRPLPAGSPVPTAEAQRIASARCSVIRGSPGSYLAEWLAGAVETWGRWHSCVWLRGSGAQPRLLAGSLVLACADRWVAAEEGWRPRGPTVEARLEETMRRSPDHSVIVVELAGSLAASVGRLMTRVRPMLVDHEASLVVVAEGGHRAPLWHGPDALVPAGALWDPGVAADQGWLPSEATARLLRLGGHRSAVVSDILQAAKTWPVDLIVDAVERSRRCRQLLDRLTANLLELCTAPQRIALETCATIGYWHPQLTGDSPQAVDLRPWVVPLEQSWGWVRPIWLGPLRRSLAGYARHGGPPERLAVGWPGRRSAQPLTAAAGALEVRLLGNFELRIDGTTVHLAGQRGVSVLRFLLARPRYACSRDQLIEEFWPDVGAGPARNRLQVAISGLRQGLRAITDLQVIEYAEGGYRIVPTLRVSVDVEQFEAALRVAAARADRRDPALAAYREAVELYRGDFAADAPYESWTLLPRESLRIRYIDALDQMSQLLLSAGRVDDCVATAHRMLDVDPCREDAHRLLMRCYLSQGRAHQAFRQYDLCRRILKATLSAAPGPETTALYQAIRAGTR